MLSRYIVGRLCYYLFITLAILNVLFFIKIIAELYPYIGVNNDNLWDMLSLLFYSLPFVNFQVLPISLFIATFLTVRQYSTGSEFVAMSAIGLPFRRIMRPVIYFSFIIVIIQAAVTLYVMPYYSNKIEELKVKLARRVFISKLIPEVPNEIENSMIYFKQFSPEQDLKDVLVVEQNNNETKIIQAQLMKIEDIILNKKLRIQFLKGKSLELNDTTLRQSELVFDSFTIPVEFDANIFDKYDIESNASISHNTDFQNLLDKRRDHLLLNEVLFLLNHPELSREDYFLYYSFVYEKVFFIFVPFVFLLCVIAFAYTIPRVSNSNKKGILLLLIIIINYMAFSTLSRWSQKGLVTPAVLFVLPSLFLILAVVLIYDTDHHFFVPVRLFFRKLNRKIKRLFVNDTQKEDISAINHD